FQGGQELGPSFGLDQELPKTKPSS
mgnify:CR=1